MEKPEHVVRMQDERGELEERIAKAQTFLDSRGSMLDRNQTHQMNNQLDVMRMYVRILNQRIEYDLHKQDFFGDADASES